ncbi:MAG: division/cell wall cluster transcriptional repressor MraZ [Desulfovibrionaceae bacterium]|nr:division/cell wall cluster transcriptional repressor MraZ [Desulfovibrionaceae bacterium]
MKPHGFITTHYRALDPKGRLILPPEYRDYLKEQCEPDSEPCLWLTGYYGKLVAYLPGEWAKIFEQLSQISFRFVKLSHFKSKVIGLAQCLTPDAQGRVRISQPLMREAGLVKDCVLVGMINKFEIWDQPKFEALSTTDDISEELAATNLELNL